MAGAIDWSQLLFGDFVDTRQLLTELYINQKLSIAAISNFLGVDDQPIVKELRRQGIPVRPKGKPGPNNLVAIPGKKQKPNRPKDYDVENALRKEGYRLGMSPDNYIPVETRKTEQRNCPMYKSCSTYTAILFGSLVPCYRCSGKPEYYESMEAALPPFRELLDSLPDSNPNRRAYERKDNDSRSDTAVIKRWLAKEKINTSRLFINSRFEVYYLEDQLYRKSIIKINDADIINLISDIPGITLLKAIKHFKSTHYFMRNKIRELKLDGKITYKYPGRYFVMGN